MTTTGESIRAPDQESVRVSEIQDTNPAAVDSARDAAVSKVPKWRAHLTAGEIRDIDGFDVQIRALSRQRKDLAYRRQMALDRWDRAAANELRARIMALDRRRRQTRTERQLIVNRGTARQRKKERRCLSTEPHPTTSSPTR